MAEKDLAGKKIEDFNEVFADIYNTLLFRRHILVPECLKAGATESIYKTDARDLNSQSRDILKKYYDKANLVISSFGIENQASIDENMPIRVMGYDAGTYRQQLYDGDAECTPVITIVLNMTQKRWSAAKSIHELIHMDDELAEYVQDYKIHVFDIAFLEDETIEAFTSDFKKIARFFKRKRLGENPFASETELQHPTEMLEFIAAFTQDRRYLDGVPYLESVKEKGGVVTMCEVADALITEGMEKGIEKGIKQGMQEGVLRGKVEVLYEMKYSVSQIADRLNISEEKVEEILTKCLND